MIRDTYCDKLAKQAADQIHDFLHPDPKSIVVLAGTGWNDKLQVQGGVSVEYRQIDAFGKLGQLKGHARRYVSGHIAGKPVILMDGRIHCYEIPYNEAHLHNVRLQVDALLALGCRKFILTCGAGGLPGTNLKPGALVVLDGLVTVFVPAHPCWGEFPSPEDVLTDVPRAIATGLGADYPGGTVEGGYVMVPGSPFEGLTYDKKFLATTGAKVVGMSMVPELDVLGLYEGAEAVGLAFVTNDSEEKHSHEHNVAMGQQYAEYLGAYLTSLIKTL